MATLKKGTVFIRERIKPPARPGRKVTPPQKLLLQKKAKLWGAEVKTEMDLWNAEQEVLKAVEAWYEYDYVPDLGPSPHQALDNAAFVLIERRAAYDAAVKEHKTFSKKNGV